MSEQQKPRCDIFIWPGQGPCVIRENPLNKQAYVQSLMIQTCPKCGGYMTTIPVDTLTASLLNTLGRMRCETCGWIPSLNVYDKCEARKK